MAINSLIPLTVDVLDAATCSNPDCAEEHGPLYFHAGCHPEATMVVGYENGVLMVDCAICEARVATVAVGR